MKRSIFFLKTILLVPVLSILFSVCVFAEEKLTVVYTNSLNGYLDDCGCKDNPKGGLLMRASEINRIRSVNNNTLLLESGDFFAPESDDLLIKYIIKGYKYIQYDVISPGDQEFSSGIEKFLNYSNELPFVCDNFLINQKNSWKPVFDRYRIIVKNNTKIGIIGTIHEHAFKYYPERITKDIRILDQVKEINRDIEALNAENVQYIILLSHSGYDRDKELAAGINGIDLIVGGHSQTWLKKPEKVGNTIIVQAGADGARIGILELVLSGGSIKILNNTFVLPHLPDFKEDANMRKMINEYNDEVKKEYQNLKFK